MTTKEVLIKARALVEKGWTRGVYARNEDDDVVAPDAPDACQWCMFGAVDAVTPLPKGWGVCCALMRAVGVVSFREAANFNDSPTTTHADVLAAFDRAIQECEK